MKKLPVWVKAALKTLLILAVCTLCSFWISRLGVSREGALMTYLLGILFITVLTPGYGYGLTASVASMMLFNFFFTEPRFTFLIYRPTDVIMLGFFLVTAMVSGTVTSRLQREKTLSDENQKKAQALYEEKERAYKEREAIRMAMEAERLRSTLLRAVAHDLRSPLTALTGASALLTDSFDRLTEEEKKKLASDICEEITWLANLVENILNMTRINEDQLVIHKQYEVVDDVVSEALSHMSRVLQHRQVTVALPDQVVELPMDGKLVTQVIVNLLDNAVKHTPQESGIFLSVTERQDDVLFVVEDSGKGIDSSVASTLFNGFVTLERGVTDGKRGIGLGLTICKAVVEAHGGSIAAENRPQGGARFSFTLPREE